MTDTVAPPRKYLGQTVEVKAAHRIDEARLAEFLGDTVPGYAGPLEVRQFEGGQSNPTYLLTTPAAKYVLRRKPPGVLLKSAHAVDREHRVMKALFEHGLPVPEPLGLCEDDSVLGTAFYVMRHVPGRVFLVNSMPDLTPAERAAVYDSANETLRACTPSTMWRRASRTSGGRGIISSARSAAGASSTRPPRPSTSSRWTS
jgi:aminoglycoside phosphotransferase (APT) family kinase protein